MDRQIDRYMVLCLPRQEVSEESQTCSRVGRYVVDRLGDDDIRPWYPCEVVHGGYSCALSRACNYSAPHRFTTRGYIFPVDSWLGCLVLPSSCLTMFCEPFCDLCMYRITEGDRGVAHCTGRKEGFCRSGIISAALMSPVESISLSYSYFFRRGL